MGYGLALTDSGLGATPAEYLDRLALNNRYFGDDVRVENVSKVNGKAVIVTSQSQIDGISASPRQIVTMMTDAGFEPIAPGTFFNAKDGVLVFDLYPKNAKFSGGEAVPIDPVLQRATSHFAEFIRQNYKRLPDYQNAEASAWTASLRSEDSLSAASADDPRLDSDTCP